MHDEQTVLSIKKRRHTHLIRNVTLWVTTKGLMLLISRAAVPQSESLGPPADVALCMSAPPTGV